MMIMLGLMRDVVILVIVSGVLVVAYAVSPSTLAPYFYPLLVADFVIRVLTA